MSSRTPTPPPPHTPPPRARRAHAPAAAVPGPVPSFSGRSPPQESSKKEVLRVCSQMDELMEEAKEEAANGSQGPSRRR